MVINQLGDRNGLTTAEIVAVLTLDEGSNILSVNDAATAMFGWEASALVGQNLRVLLKEDLGCDLRALMHRPQQAGDGTPGLSSLRVTACRRNGTEFVASISMLQWCSDTTLMRRTDSSPSPWTAVFRDIAGADAEGQGASVPGNGNSVAQPVEDLRQQAQEHENLNFHIIAAETELSRVRKEREQASEAGQQLEKKAQDLTASNEDLARQLAQKREREQELQKRSAQQLDQLKAFAENAARLESQLRQCSAEVESVKAEHERLEARWREERKRLEVEFRAQLNVATTNVERAESALEKEAARNRNFEEQAQIFSESIRLEQNERDQLVADELAALQQIRDDLSGKLTAKEQALLESEQRSQQLERRLGEIAGDLEAAQAEGAKLIQERAILMTDHQAQIDAAKRERDEQEVALEFNLVNLRTERHEIYDKFRRGQEAGMRSIRRTEELEKRSRKLSTALKQAKAELKEKAAAHARLETDLQKETAARQSAEEQVRATAQISEAHQGIVASLLENARLLQSSLEEFEPSHGRSSAGVVINEQDPKPGNHRPADLANAETSGHLKP